MAYEINYEDERFQKVESDREQALTELEKTYGGLQDQSGAFYQEQIDASKAWAEQQSALQQEQSELALEQLRQQQEQARKDYTREQSAAWADWKRESGAYGVNAETLAGLGMTGTGYSESSRVRLYNAYQNRVATARDSYDRAVLHYNNAIKEARLQNSAALAQIAYDALHQQLELALEGFRYRAELLQLQQEQKLQIESDYHSRYQDVLEQINSEYALAEQIRQFNERQALERQKLEEDQRQFDEKMAFQRQQYAAAQAGRTYYGGGGGGKQEEEQEEDPLTGAKPTFDQTSIRALGYGPMTPQYLAELIAAGEVVTQINGKKITVSRVGAQSNKYKNNQAGKN